MRLPLIACSLDATGQQARLAEWLDVLGEAVSREKTPNGARFTFVADGRGEQRIRELAAAEHECCSFLEFDVTRSADQLVLSVTAPADGLDALSFIFSA
jgi:MerR family copper efflux transcriptional regulator